MILTRLNPTENTIEAVIAAAARRAGCVHDEEIQEFIDPLPPIRNSIALLPEYSAARDRIARAVENQEKIVVYGDYDCDGITALVQMHDLLRAAGHPQERLAWFIPDRMANGYGLTDSGVERCFEKHDPQLVLCVDCASTARLQIAWLRERGAETIVFDHHSVASSPDSHPAVAHLNPKAFLDEHPTVLPLCELSAAGIVFLFAEQFARDRALPRWNRERALLLAGLGTYVDVMPVTGLNRALIKHSLALANSHGIKAIPGLCALKEISKTREAKAETYGFQWGPRLNATGRMDDACLAVHLLLGDDAGGCQTAAEYLDKINAERQAEQKIILAQALEQATQQAVGRKVIVVANRSWHTGIIGIVAGRLKDKFHRPAIVFGWDNENDCWKGSGRSVDGFDLGEAVHTAVKATAALSGGGHAKAAGLSISADGLETLRAFLETACTLRPEDFVPNYLIAGRHDDFTPAQWIDTFDRLAPPPNRDSGLYMLVGGARLIRGPYEATRKSDGEVWALQAKFVTTRGPDDTAFYVTWSDLERARAEWHWNSSYDLVVSLTQTNSHKDGLPVSYTNWMVEDSSGLIT